MLIHANSCSKTVAPAGLIDFEYKIAVQFKCIEYKKGWTLNIC